MCEVKGANSLEAIHCPNCHRALPENSQYCIQCGEFFAPADAGLQNMRAGQEVSASSGGTRKTRPLTEQSARRPAWVGRRITSSLMDEEDEDGALGFGIEEEMAAEQRHVTWQKVVETPSRPPAIHPPRPPLPPQSHPILRHIPYGHSRVSPVVLFWCCMVVLFFFVGGGVFGIMGTLGRGRVASVAGPTLQITPADVSMGGTVNLRGSGFSPRARIGLTRDDFIPVVDTDGTTTTTSQADGSFTDTVIVESDWTSGTHTISVEDATTHKFTSSPIQVTGVGDLLRPAHLNLSATSLDLGAGDQATNSMQKVALTNLGGGQIVWKADATQPWLTISPKSGTFSSGMQTEVEIAVDRTNLQPGSFSDQVLFSSSAGDASLPIKMSVMALPLQNEAVLQVSPAALSFTGNDGGSAPDAQVVSISNPGQGLLHWTAETDVPWLAISSRAGDVNAFASAQAKVSVDTSNLLPGTYNGNITFRGDGTGGVMHDLQNVAVSVTITPACALAVASDTLAFTAAYQQSAPDAKVINLSTANCSSSTPWKAISHASWLTVSQTNGSTPAKPAIGINVAGLQPGTYNSSVTFSSKNGKQEVPVRFIMSQLAEPVLSVGSTGGLNFHGIVGQGDTTTQNLMLTNTGSGTLLWSANASTGNSGNWLSLSSSSGSISSHQSAVLTVTNRTLASMAPGTYSGTINIAATDQQGRGIVGSPQHIPVSTVVSASCAVAVSPSALTFSNVAGQAAPVNQSIMIAAGNGCVNILSWTASAVSDNGGKWLTTTATMGSSGANKPGVIGVGIAPGGLTAGSYHGSITITTLDSVTHATIGNPQVVGVTLNVTAPPPTPFVEVSNTTLAFSTSAGTNPASQTITIVNTGSSDLSWQTASPSQPWLSVSPSSGSNAAGASSTITLSANVAGLTPGIYQARVVIKPSSGPPIIVRASLRISGATPTPAITPDPTPLPTATPQPSPTPVATPTPDITPTPLPNPPTPTAISRGAPPPVPTVAPSPNPTPAPTPVPTVAPSPNPTPAPTLASTPKPIPVPTPNHGMHNPLPTPSPAAIPTPTPLTKTYTPPKHVKSMASPTPPPQAAPTETPALEARPTPERQVVPTQKPVMKVTPTSESQDIPTQVPVLNKEASPTAIPTASSGQGQSEQPDPVPTP